MTGAGTKGSPTVRLMRSTGLHYADKQQLHEKQFIT
jgi:hypothetical protein